MPIHVDLCLGSSCFARGGRDFAAVVSDLRARGATLEVVGHRCRDRCRHGPNVTIDGVDHRVADAAALRALLQPGT